MFANKNVAISFSMPQPRYTAEDWDPVFDYYAWKTTVFGNHVIYAIGFPA